MARWVNGIAFRDIEFSSHGKPILKIAEIKNGISGQTKFTNQVFDEDVHVRAGDLLFSWSGQPETSIDAFRWRGPDGWLNQHVFRVFPSDGIDNGFLYYLLRYLKPNFIGIARNKQTTGLGHVTRRDMEHLLAAHPGLEEQRSIAGILGALDDKIQLNQRMNQTLEAVLFSMFEPGENWEPRPLTDAFEINPKRALKKGVDAPYLDMQQMPTVGYRPAAWTRRAAGSGSRFWNGDTLVARITPCLENGKTAFVDFLEKGEVGWGSTEFIVLSPKPPLPPEFGYCIARTAAFRTHCISNMSGSSGRQRVPVVCLDQFVVHVPPAAIVERLAATARALMAVMRANAEQVHSLGMIRDTLLPKLMSGEIRVTAPVAA